MNTQQSSIGDEVKLGYRDAQEWFRRVTDPSTPFEMRLELLAQLPRHWQSMERALRAIAMNFQTGDLPKRVVTGDLPKRAPERSAEYQLVQRPAQSPPPMKPGVDARLRNTIIEVIEEVMARASYPSSPASDKSHDGEDQTLFLTEEYIERRITDQRRRV